MAALEQWGLLAARMQQLNEEKPAPAAGKADLGEQAGEDRPDAAQREELRRWYARHLESLPAEGLTAEQGVDELADRWLNYGSGEGGLLGAPAERAASRALIERAFGDEPIAPWLIDEQTGLSPKRSTAPDD